MKKINNKKIVFSLGILAILTLGVITMPVKANADRAGYVTSYNSTSFNNNVSGNNQYNAYQGQNSFNSTSTVNPVPVINFTSPSSSNVGVGAKTVTITGGSFIRSSTARVNGSDRPTTFVDNSHLLMQITGNDTFAYYSNGGFFVTVFNPAPGGGYSNATFFTVKNTGTSSTASRTTANTANNTATNFSDINQTENVGSTGEGSSNLASNAIFGSNGIIPSSLIQWVFFAILILLIVILVRRIYGGSEKYHAVPLKHD